MGQSRPFRNVAIVVEDDSDQRCLAATLFEESDFEVKECESAEDALAVLESIGSRVAIVFSDILLAGALDGVDLAQLVAERFPQVRMIVTSGAAGARTSALPTTSRFMPKPWPALNLLREAELTIATKG